MRINSTTIICLNKAGNPIQPRYNVSESNSTTMIVVLRNSPKSQLWIPYVLIGISCVVFLAVHFWCYHKRNRERYLRKREEKRVKCGLMERRRITSLMIARYSDFGFGSVTKLNTGDVVIDGSFYGHKISPYSKHPAGSIYERADTNRDADIISGRLSLSVSMPEQIRSSVDNETVQRYINQLKLIDSIDTINPDKAVHSSCKEINQSQPTINENKGPITNQKDLDGSKVKGCACNVSIAPSLPPSSTQTHQTSRSRACSVPDMTNTKLSNAQYNAHRFPRPNKGSFKGSLKGQCPDKHKPTHQNRFNTIKVVESNAETYPNVFQNIGYNTSNHVSPANSTSGTLLELCNENTSRSTITEKGNVKSDSNTTETNVSNGTIDNSHDLEIVNILSPKDASTSMTDIDLIGAKNRQMDDDCFNEFCMSTSSSVISMDTDKSKPSYKTPALRSLDSSLVFGKSSNNTK